MGRRRRWPSSRWPISSRCSLSIRRPNSCCSAPARARLPPRAPARGARGARHRPRSDGQPRRRPHLGHAARRGTLDRRGADAALTRRIRAQFHGRGPASPEHPADARAAPLVPLPAEPLRRAAHRGPGRRRRRAAPHRLGDRRRPRAATSRPASGRSTTSRAPPTSAITIGVPQASASTQTLARPSRSVGRTIDVGGGEQGRQLFVRAGAEEAGPRSARPRAAPGAPAPRRSGPSPTSSRVASGKSGQRLDREAWPLRGDQRAGGDEQRPVDAERRLGGGAVDRAGTGRGRRRYDGPGSCPPACPSAAMSALQRAR